MITWFPPASTENWVEQSLWQNYSFVEETTIADHRALQFNTTAPATLNCETDFLFDPSILLDAYGTRFDSNDLFVTLRWQAQRDIESDYSWFVHVLDEAGNIIAQQDRQSIGGYAPTSTWQNDFIVDDFLMFNLPDKSVMDDIQLRIGYVEISTGELQTVTLDGQNLDTAYITISPNCE